MKESVLKMSTKEKIYKGDVYSFTRPDHYLNRGGNGAVYDVTVRELNTPVVAKFFDYSGSDKNKRYERFKREISFLSDFKDVDGVIDILDKNCPQELSREQDESWYLMPKAKEYNVKFHKSLKQKLDDMISLARTLENLHSKEYAHRDIKPENILLLDGKVILADFGLAWNPNMERLTASDERVGPYRILPPELEHIDDMANIDYRCSDVYLFAKMLWMVLKRDNNGFRGQYDRADSQIYLSKRDYSVCTLEPIHKLLETSTYDDISKRITINDCIKLLEYQKQIAVNPDSISSKELKTLQYEEESRRMVLQNEPDEIIYLDEASISNILQKISKGLISVSVINITDTENNQLRQIQTTNLIVDSDNICRFEFFVSGKKVKEYLANVNKIVHHKKDETYILLPGELDADTSEYISFGESLTGFNVNSPKIYLTPKEKIILSKPNSI